MEKTFIIEDVEETPLLEDEAQKMSQELLNFIMSFEFLKVIEIHLIH
jgi:hypothetical protein